VDGLIVLNSPWHRELPFPVVTISSHHDVPGVNSIVLDHHRVAELALGHLIQLGHREIAFIKGQAFTQDTEERWRTIAEVATKVGLRISDKLVVQMDENLPTSELGYRVTQQLLESGQRFTALFAFNDISAIGAIRALHERGLRVPHDVSVIGVDDIDSAAYQHPGLTTIRQPLREMGRMAAETVLRAITNATGKGERITKEVMVEPVLIVRGTTCAVHKKAPPARSHDSAAHAGVK
jgi:LacI family transcriptional regulator